MGALAEERCFIPFWRMNDAPTGKRWQKMFLGRCVSVKISLENVEDLGPSEAQGE